jgi:hypothetical protein
VSGVWGLGSGVWGLGSGFHPRIVVLMCFGCHFFMSSFLRMRISDHSLSARSNHYQKSGFEDIPRRNPSTQTSGLRRAHLFNHRRISFCKALAKSLGLGLVAVKHLLEERHGIVVEYQEVRLLVVFFQEREALSRFPGGGVLGSGLVFGANGIQCDGIQYSMLTARCFSCVHFLVLVSSDGFLGPGVTYLGIRASGVEGLTLQLGGLKVLG